MATATATPGVATGIPTKELTEAIDRWWEEQTLERTNDPFARGTLYDVLTDVDSLSAVNVLLVLDPIVGIKLPESLIKPGGYGNRQEMINQLIPAISNLFSKRTH
jgi:hypothetical protein